MLQCWVVTDGRAGIENQALGLAEAVARRTAIRITTKRIRIGEPWRSLPGAWWGDPLERLRKEGALLRPPYPDLLIGCGRLAAPIVAAVKQKHPKTFVVQLQTPPVATGAFDLVIPPDHDRLSGANVFPILGAPHRATRARLDADAALLAAAPELAALAPPRVAVLLGGPNRAYRFGAAEGAALGAALAGLSRNGYSLLATPSRRTRSDAATAIRASLEGAPHFWWSGGPVGGLDNPYFGLLGLADFVLVTADSVNMAAEAAITGAPVLIIDLPRKPLAGDAKFRRFRKALEARGAAHPFEGVLERRAYEPLDETARAAAEVLRRMTAMNGAA